MNDKPIIKPVFSWIIRIVGTAVFSWLILRSVDTRAILDQIRNINIWVYVGLCIIYLFQHFFMAVRWKKLLSAVGLEAPIIALYKTILFGQVLNKILPSSIGGDSAKIAYVIYNHPEEKEASISATIMDRIIGLFALCFIVFITLPFVDFVSKQYKLIGLMIFGSIIVISSLIFFGILDGLVTWVMSRTIAKNIIGVYINKIWSIFQRYRVNNLELLSAFLISILVKIIMIVSQHYTFMAIGVDVPLLTMFLVIPLVNLVTTIPISIGGLGLREASLASLLDVANDQVVSYSLIRYSISIVISVFLIIIFSIHKLFQPGEKQ